MLGEDDEDVINEVCIYLLSTVFLLTQSRKLSVSDSKKHLAFATDAGTVGVVDLSNMSVTRMKTMHNNVS